MLSQTQAKAGLLALAISLLIGCGGGGGGGSNNTNNTPLPSSSTSQTISITAVKGPLINAAFNFYRLDKTNITPDTDKDQEVEIEIEYSNTQAQIELNGSSLNETLLIELDTSNAIEINNNNAPVLNTLQTLYQANSNNQAIYATPLTTLTIQIAFINANKASMGYFGNEDGTTTLQEFESAIPVASKQLLEMFGFGLDENTDLFHTAPLITNETTDLAAQEQVLRYRTAIESTVALLINVQNNLASPPSIYVLLEELAKDIADGEVNGDSFGTPTQLSQVSNLTSLLSEDPENLNIPGNNEQKISSIVSVIKTETNETGFNSVDTSNLNPIPPEPVILKPDDVDNDGVSKTFDPDDKNPCTPSTFNSQCNADEDSDGKTDFEEGPSIDTDEDGIPDYRDSAEDDTDNDGTKDELDKENNNPCEPNVFVSNCTRDSDGDGETDYSEGENTDFDFDGKPDHLESSIADTDQDGIQNEFDSADNNACIPKPFNSKCNSDNDADGLTDYEESNEGLPIDINNDGTFDHEDACMPSVFNPACNEDTDDDGKTDFEEGPSIDTDEDGIPDYRDSAEDDTDNDGINDENDPANDDKCIPNPETHGCPGIQSRPDNTSCIAPTRIFGDSELSLQRRFPNLSLTLPLKMIQPPNDSSVWYLAQQTGQIIRFSNDNNLPNSEKETYLTVPSYFGNDERGFLGMAFSPGWPDKQEIYVNYISFTNSVNRSIISRLVITDDSTLPVQFNEEILLTINQPYTNHNGGNMEFGNDGYLYIGMGDGGSSGDPQNNSQNTKTLLGSLLRIHVNGIPFIDDNNPDNYQIPSSNIFSSNTTKCPTGIGSLDCPEIYAWGLRNPWRWSFDKDNQRLWLADVGQNAREEINIITNGKNYGWRCKEGSKDFIGCSGDFENPVHEYDRSNNDRSVTGGYVYRGTSAPSLNGKYIFGDYESGRIWALEQNNGAYIATELFDTDYKIASFAENNDGEIYFFNYIAGEIYQIVQTGGGSSGVSDDGMPNQLSDFGCITVNNGKAKVKAIEDGVIPYEPNARFWSDDAEKARWLSIPNNTTIDPGNDWQWEYPEGTVTVKNFVVADKLIETRFFVRHPDGGWAGYTYEWNEEETNATRVVGGKTRTLTHNNNQEWIYPSEGQCMQCHTAASGYLLGASTAQLNRQLTYPNSIVPDGITDNQLSTLNHIGFFSPEIIQPSVEITIPDPTEESNTLTERAKAYLHTNCASCHQPDGGTQASIDLRYQIPLADMGVCNINPSLGNIDINNAKIVSPGDSTTSVLLKRMQLRNDDNQMPPIGSHIIDLEGLELISQWIDSLTVNDCN